MMLHFNFIVRKRREFPFYIEKAEAEPVVMRLPVTRGLSTILYREDFDETSGTWRDTTHRKSFTSDDVDVNANGAVAMTYSGLDTITNGLQNGFTVYAVVETKNWESGLAQFANFNNGNALTIYTLEAAWIRISSTIFGTAYLELTRYCSGGRGFFVLRYDPSAGELSAYGFNGSGGQYEKISSVLANPSNTELVIGLDRIKQYSYTYDNYLHFFAVGETYQTDEEVIANCNWLRENYDVY